MLRVAICDDERRMRVSLETLVERIGEKHQIKLDIEVFDSGTTLLMKVNSGEEYDIIFLDILMKHMNGIETAIQIRELDRAVQIIYVTAYDQYMRAAFDALAVGFLSKPVEWVEFERTFLKAMRYVRYESEYYYFEYKKKGYRVQLRNVIYFQSDRREVKIIGVSGTFQQYEKLSVIESKLADCKEKFLRIHNRYLVSQRYIEKYTHEYVIMINGISLPISRERKGQIIHFI